MSSKIIRMQRPAQGELSEIAARLEKELWRAEPIGKTCRSCSGGHAVMLNFEKLYFRNGSYAGLAVLLTDFNGLQTADIVGSGGGEGIFNFSWGANAEFADDAAQILRGMGFTDE